ncbi:amidohydrolase [Marivita sp. S0852]|uniref:amidohydrolase n=1 Tax=Marivita sp. S0852 TaxID=3373893 RepID=UPI0039824309
MNKSMLPILGSVLAVGLISASSGFAQDKADRIWSGGPILTMTDDTPTAEAIAAKDGKILAVGTLEEMMAHQGDATDMVDLAGETLLPGFVDAHGHVFMIGVQASSANMLPAPDGTVNDIAAMQEELRSWFDANPEVIEAAGFLLGFGYDDAQLAEQRHPTRQDLDAVSTDIPIVVVHQSGHLAVFNSKALDVAGIGPDTPDPEGGVIRREDGTDMPNGVLEETAVAAAFPPLLTELDVNAVPQLVTKGAALIASYGYTTAQEGRGNPQIGGLIRSIADAGALDIDVVMYSDILLGRDYIVENKSQDYTNRFRIGGAKLTIDGSPQGFTALRDRPYYNPPEGFREDYAGYAAVPTDDIFDQMDFAFENDIQIMVHANGEGAMDLHIAALRAATDAHGSADRRPVLIHGQFVREDQIDAYKALGVFPSLFPMHTFYWGDWHRDRTVGPVIADNISPTGWLVERDMMFSSHHDAPVAFPDSMRILDATVTRRSRSGDILGPQHRVDVITGLKAMTIWPAYQHFEEDIKGSLEVGKLADFAILSADPTAVDPETLDTIQVMETIKEGDTIFRRD